MAALGHTGSDRPMDPGLGGERPRRVPRRPGAQCVGGQPPKGSQRNLVTGLPRDSIPIMRA